MATAAPKTILALGVAGLVALLLAGAADSAPDGPRIPVATLKAEGKHQQRQAFTGTEVSRREGDDECIGLAIDGFPFYPRALKIGRRTRQARIRFAGRPTPPEDLAILDFKRLDDDGSPTGKARDRRFKILRHNRPGKAPRYRARFRVKGKRDHYLIVIGYWADPGGCGVNEALFAFHLRGR